MVQSLHWEVLFLTSQEKAEIKLLLNFQYFAVSNWEKEGYLSLFSYTERFKQKHFLFRKKSEKAILYLSQPMYYNPKQWNETTETKRPKPHFILLFRVLVHADLWSQHNMLLVGIILRTWMHQKQCTKCIDNGKLMPHIQ